MGPRNVVLGVPKQRHAEAGTPCELRHWDLRWSSLWGHETCEGCADMGDDDDADDDDDDDDDDGGDDDDDDNDDDGRREEGEEEGVRMRGAVSSKRGPNTTGWLGIA